jgi:solute:Na+ symporter, SSS family
VHPIAWAIVVVYVGWVLVDGVRRAHGTKEIEGYFLAGRTLPWWAVGLSVMATQLSAVTMIGTTGQGATDGLRFIQFYFGLPIAMVLLGVTLVPFLHGARVYTAYEYLERRFDAKTRSLTAFLFLLSRGMSCGTIIAAPAVVFSAIFGWNLTLSVALMGVPTVLYTMLGGVQAVTWADVKQMAFIVVSIGSVVVMLLWRIPVHAGDAMAIAGSVGRLRTFDFSFTLTETYTFWSGIIGGTFLMLSYFGTDQSQVQRYLSARSVDAARSSLLMSAYWKIPLQALILLVGVLVFVFYLFTRPPMLYNPNNDEAARKVDAAAYASLEGRYGTELAAREAAAHAVVQARRRGDEAATTRALADFRAREQAANGVRTEALALAARGSGEKTVRDVNYIIPRVVRDQMPPVVMGLFIAGVLAAAMSSIAAELNSLATSTVIDFYRRWVRADGSDAHFLAVSKLATLVWGVFACGVATYAADLGSLIEVVNRFGSFFYGSILGVFLLAMIPRARALGAFAGLIVGMAAVAAVARFAPSVSFLWHNVVGAVTVVIIGLLLSVGVRGQHAAATGGVSGEGGLPSAAP